MSDANQKMGEVIYAAKAFKQHARNLQNYRVNSAANIHDYIFLKLAHPKKPRTCMMVAVSLLQYPDIQIEKDDFVRLRLTSEKVGMMRDSTPHTIVAYIEKLGGEIILEPIVQAQRQQRVLGR